MNSAVMAREDLLQRVTAEAGRRGVRPDDLLNQVVETGLAHLPMPPEMAAEDRLRSHAETVAASECVSVLTGADLLARWQHEDVLLPAEGAPDAPALARRIREQNQRRFL